MSLEETIRQGTEEQAAVFGVLSDPTRLGLLKLLCRRHDPDALCVNALAGLLGVSQSAVSQHLRVLKAIGVVKGERRGYHIHYYANRDRIGHCQQLLSAALTVEGSGQEESCDARCSDRRKQSGKKRKHKSSNLD